MSGYFKPKYDIAELQADLDIVKDRCYEMSLSDQLLVDTDCISEEKKSWLERMRQRQVKHAYERLDKAINSLNEAIHYLENYESLRG